MLIESTYQYDGDGDDGLITEKLMFIFWTLCNSVMPAMPLTQSTDQ